MASPLPSQQLERGVLVEGAGLHARPHDLEHQLPRLASDRVDPAARADQHDQRSGGANGR